VPHATLDEAAQGAQQTRSVGMLVPGGTVQTSPGVQAVPTPPHVRHVRPSVSVTVIGTPHAMLAAAGQAGQHAPSMQLAPSSQRVPSPLHSSPPTQVAGMASPHATSVGARHSSRHSQLPSTQPWPSGQVPSQRPPHPSGAPHTPSGGHDGTHSHRPVSGLHSSSAFSHGPIQNPPQPSGAPQVASAGHRGTQVHLPEMHRSGATHAGSQPHVAMQRPSWQTSPRSQVTPAQGFAMHVPARQNSPSAHVTPSHAERGVQER
jgi:hypothetical protein